MKNAHGFFWLRLPRLNHSPIMMPAITPNKRTTCRRPSTPKANNQRQNSQFFVSFTQKKVGFVALRIFRNQIILISLNISRWEFLNSTEPASNPLPTVRRGCQQDNNYLMALRINRDRKPTRLMKNQFKSCFLLQLKLAFTRLIYG
jgi:hypothetical protein